VCVRERETYRAYIQSEREMAYMFVRVCGVCVREEGSKREQVYVSRLREREIA